MTGSPKPNQLSGQVSPNTLRTPGPRVADRIPKATPNALSGHPAPPRAPTAHAYPNSSSPPTPPTSQTSPSGWALPQRTSPAPTARRSFSWWSLIVVAIFVANIARAFLDSNGSVGVDNPTTAPAATAVGIVPRPTTTAVAPTPGSSLTPGVGVIDFGTGKAANCEPTGIATTFPVGTSVWWLAHLGVAQPQDATVTWVVTRNGSTVTGGRGPREFQAANWDQLCGNGPILSKGPGTYVVTVLDSTGRILLSTGTYTLGGS